MTIIYVAWFGKLLYSFPKDNKKQEKKVFSIIAVGKERRDLKTAFKKEFPMKMLPS